MFFIRRRRCVARAEGRRAVARGGKGRRGQREKWVGLEKCGGGRVALQGRQQGSWRAGRPMAFKMAARGGAPVSAEEGRRKGEAGVVL